MRGGWALGIALVGLLAGCSHHHRATTTAAAPVPRLLAVHACGKATCARLNVPLDHSDRTRGRLTLRVVISGSAGAPRGTLVFLTGGPGQPGTPFLARVKKRLGTAFSGYRLVMLDQRGTGAAALRCPALQRAAGASDLTVPPPSAIDNCARTVGPARAFYTTADTVADLDQLRQALGVRHWTLDGVSYGTFVAERYALAHPRQVTRLVLDSVVPQTGIEPFQLETIQAVPRVLRSACADLRCTTDPARDLAAVVRSRHDGPALLDTLVTISIFDPRFRAVPGALMAARAGRPAALDRLVAAVHRGSRVPARILSQGLHTSAVCEDFPRPWGGPAVPVARRKPAIEAAAARLTPSRPWPFDRATVLGNGELLTCERWPPVAVTPPVATGSLPNVPVLLLAGDRDLSTPLAWPEDELRHAPGGQLVVVHGAGHSVQLRSKSPVGHRAVTRFLHG